MRINNKLQQKKVRLFQKDDFTVTHIFKCGKLDLKKFLCNRFNGLFNF
jgi:hypothetical protein